jgi:folylpolyglutamate synthase/dihydropteroate synthase
MYDSTNIVPKPIVTGVTALGLDHITVLGKTLAEIGWQKGGIYKVSACGNSQSGLQCLFPCLHSQVSRHLR